MGNIKLFLKISIFIFLYFWRCKDPGYFHDVSWQVLYTDPMGNYQASGEKIENSIASLIINARQSVYMAVYNFDSQVLLASLVEAKNRRLNIQIVGDYNELNSNGYRALVSAGFEIIAGNQNAIAHNKFIVIDQKIVVAGTGNFTHSGFYQNDNNFIIITDPEIASIYAQEFRQMHTGFFSTLKSSQRSAAYFKSGIPIKVFFSPQESSMAIREMIAQIDAARNSIYYMIFAFTHDEIASALVRAARRGVQVYGIHDSNFIKGTSEEAPRLYMSGFDSSLTPYASGPFVRKEGNKNSTKINGMEYGGKLHCKTMLIDPDTENATAITGSFNWSGNAVEKNDENLLVIHDKKTVNVLKRQWDNVWKYSLSLKKTFSEISGSASSQNDIIITEIAFAGISNGSSLNEDDDFIEIYNSTSRDIDLTHWTISWSHDDFQYSYTFPDSNDGTPLSQPVIAPGQYKIIYGKSSGISEAAAAYFQNGIKIPSSKDFFLQEEDLRISIYDRRMNVIDSVHYTPARPGYDPLLANSHSVNRRMKQNKPDTGWYISKMLCLQSVCQNPYFHGSPGYKSEPAGAPEFQEISYANPDSVRAIFSGDVSSCLNPGGFFLSGLSGFPAINKIEKGKVKNELVFYISGIGPPENVYKLNSTAYGLLNSTTILADGGIFYLGSENGLIVSSDNGLTFHSTSIDNFKINHIRKDISSGAVYIASDYGLYVSSDKGQTFQQVHVSINPLANIVFDAAADANFVFVATGAGLFFSSGNPLSFQKISGTGYALLNLTNSMLFAGATGQIDIFSAPWTNPPAIARLTGHIFEIKNINGVYYAGTSNGLWTSIDGINYVEAYAAAFSGKIINDVQPDSQNNPLIVNNETIHGIYSNGIQSFQPLVGALPVLFAQLAQINGGYFAAGSYGFFSGISLSTMQLQLNTECFRGKYMPANAIVFNGYDSINPDSSAKVLLNEISMVYPDMHDWIELYVLESGNLKGIKLEYYEDNHKDFLYRFSSLYVHAGDIVLVYLNSPHQAWLQSQDRILSRSSPCKVYSTHANLNRGDGIILLENRHEYLDALYYSNRDGNISAGLMNGGLKKIYFNDSIQKVLPNPTVFPVSQWNEPEVQASGVLIPGSGNYRTISRSESNSWIISGNPTPGIK
ncbi:MAG: phospholipase D-like domain-containing protein [Spirochaetia bacterium]|nr:phospholipase D-like domain-containing protein [Spirochaetia bacterium]